MTTNAAPNTTTGHPERWEERWASNNTGWDQGGAHPALVSLLSSESGSDGRKGGDELGIKWEGRALVPGCGMVRRFTPAAYRKIIEDCGAVAVHVGQPRRSFAGSASQLREMLRARSRSDGSFDRSNGQEILYRSGHELMGNVAMALSALPRCARTIRGWRAHIEQGYDVALFAQRGLHTTGLDIAPTGVAAARQYLAKAAHESAGKLDKDKMAVEQADFFEYDPEDKFDVILDYTYVACPLLSSPFHPLQSAVAGWE